RSFRLASFSGLIGSTGGTLFVRHTNPVQAPLIAPRRVYGSGFGAVNLVNMIYGGGVAALAALVPLYATTRYGLGAFQSGTVLVAQSLGRSSCPSSVPRCYAAPGTGSRSIPVPSPWRSGWRAR